MTNTAETLETLMQRALAGDQHAYADLLLQTAHFLRPYLAKRLNYASDAEDVLQEVLLSIHKARHTYDGKRPYKPWAFAIAQFRLLDYLRTHYVDRLRQTVEISEVENIISENVTESTVTYESISGEIRQLPEKQATILQMMHQEGYTAKEVAEKTGMNESAVKVAAHRAYKILRRKLLE